MSTRTPALANTYADLLQWGDRALWPNDLGVIVVPQKIWQEVYDVMTERVKNGTKPPVWPFYLHKDGHASPEPDPNDGTYE